MNRNFIYIANIRLPTEKAHGVQIMKMCEAFSRKGAEVTLVVPKRLNFIQTDPFKYYGVEKVFKIKKIATLDLIRFGRIGFWIESLVFAEFASWFIFWKKINRERFMCFTRDELIAFYLSNIGIQVTLEAHTARDNFIVGTLRKRDHKIIAISNGIADFYKKLGVKERNILVAHDAVDLNVYENINDSKSTLRTKLNLPFNKKIVSYVGKRHTMGVDKGVEDLSRIFNELSTESPNVYPLIISDVLPTEIPSYIKASDVLVMNYPNTIHYSNYMSPLKMFEYMASGNPIVSTDLPAIREVLNEHNSFLVPVGSIKGGIKEVLQNYTEGESRAKRALIDVRNYTWEKRASNILKFIK
jgi:glycosyltransferase involved in cell wall biosynthesis